MEPLTMLAADTDTDDLTDEEEVEEKLVFLELDSRQEFGNSPQIRFLGLDQDKPMVTINGVTYRGAWEDALGTLLFLEESPDEPDSPDAVLRDNMASMFSVKLKTDKVLKLSRCVIVKTKDVYEDMRKFIKRTEGQDGADSSEEENLEEFYSSNVESEIPGLTAEPVSKSSLPQPSTSMNTTSDQNDSFESLSQRNESLHRIEDLLEICIKPDTQSDEEFDQDDTLESFNQSNESLHQIEDPDEIAIKTKHPKSRSLPTPAQMSAFSPEQSQETPSDLDDSLLNPTESGLSGELPGNSAQGSGSQITNQLSDIQIKTEFIDLHASNAGCSKFT